LIDTSETVHDRDIVTAEC